MPFAYHAQLKKKKTYFPYQHTNMKGIYLIHFPKHFFHEEQFKVMGMKMQLWLDLFH